MVRRQRVRRLEAQGTRRGSQRLSIFRGHASSVPIGNAKTKSPPPAERARTLGAVTGFRGQGVHLLPLRLQTIYPPPVYAFAVTNMLRTIAITTAAMLVGLFLTTTPVTAQGLPEFGSCGGPATGLCAHYHCASEGGEDLCLKYYCPVYVGLGSFHPGPDITFQCFHTIDTP